MAVPMKVLVVAMLFFLSVFGMKEKKYNFDDLGQRNKPIIMNLKQDTLGLIINQLLTIQDILNLRATCQAFKNLLRPNGEAMVTFCNYSDSRGMINVNLYWINLEYFLNENYDTALHEMKIFAISEDRYAILTRGPDKKIIPWLKKNVKNNNQLEPLVKVYNILDESWVEYIKGGNVENCGGRKIEIPSDLLPKMKQIKTIVATGSAFAVLLYNGDVFAWGHKMWGGLIPYHIQAQLKNIKMIYSNYYAFVALSKDGKAYSWGNPEFPDMTTNIENVKMIFSTVGAFSALLNDGSVRVWGNESSGGDPSYEFQSHLKNVQMIISNNKAFIALLENGGTVSWGNDSAQDQLHQFVSQIYNRPLNLIYGNYLFNWIIVAMKQ